MIKLLQKDVFDQYLDFFFMVYVCSNLNIHKPKNPIYVLILI